MDFRLHACIESNLHVSCPSPKGKLFFLNKKVEHFLPYAFKMGENPDDQSHLHEGDVDATQFVQHAITRPMLRYIVQDRRTGENTSC